MNTAFIDLDVCMTVIMMQTMVNMDIHFLVSMVFAIASSAPSIFLTQEHFPSAETVAHILTTVKAAFEGWISRVHRFNIYDLQGWLRRLINAGWHLRHHHWLLWVGKLLLLELLLLEGLLWVNYLGLIVVGCPYHRFTLRNFKVGSCLR